LILKEKEK
jgi:hypothetical protein